MINLTPLQFFGICFVSGFIGAITNELLNKVEILYEDYKKKKENNKSES